MSTNGQTVTDILAGVDASASSSQASVEALMPLVYSELRRLAARFLAGERGANTLQPTAVVHEAYLRLVDQSRVSWQGRTHFLAVGAIMMRRIVVDHARQRARAKRGGDWQRITLPTGADPAAPEPLALEELLDLEVALSKLAALDERQARVVELRYFGGLTNEETASLLGVSLRTVVGLWSHARAWLRRELDRNRKG
jgi:RNA polymerase sigma-70 factor (ECF subfamily)